MNEEVKVVLESGRICVQFQYLRHESDKDLFCWDGPLVCVGPEFDDYGPRNAIEQACLPASSSAPIVVNEQHLLCDSSPAGVSREAVDLPLYALFSRFRYSVSLPRADEESEFLQGCLRRTGWL
ncbi:hypothetical protein M569_02388 [Genlisea aurea]|uniref:Uncharacterized protein n=1 Tax=Genlisea aurea TaxID=192259 RepID=S8E954_9LAMI|nr:hypothetical protein M569_02388 [Genlisea aurea]